MKTIEIRIEQILGRQLLAANNQPVGRIEEFRVEVSGKVCVVREVVIGMQGIFERMNLGARMVVGAKPRGGRVARVDQIDFTNPSKPRLVVDVSELAEL